MEDGTAAKSGRTVLIVDDDPHQVAVLQEALASRVDTISAGNGVEALRISWSQDPPDVVLLAIDLDGMDGYEVCATLKGDVRTEEIPVILLATQEQMGETERGLGLGATDYLVKPVNLPLLGARIDTQLALLHQREILQQVHQRDEVTGLPNQDHFEERLDREWRRGWREGTPLSLILLAIDFSHAIHEVCDASERNRCYREVAGVLRSWLRRATDYLARYGDEHFAAVLSATDARGATTTAEMLREKVAEQRIEISYSNIVDRITISVGTASIVPRSDSSVNVLKRAAAKMLTEAMDRGRNRVESIDFDPPSLPWFA